MLNLKRLALALVVVVPLVASTLYLFVPRETDPRVRAATIVDTPGSQGRKLGLQPGDMAPNFEVSTHDGRRVKLSDFRGRPVLINFWARWCTSCLSEMPEIKAQQAERGVDSFAVLAVNAGETRAQAVEFIDYLRAPFTYGLDPGLKLSDATACADCPTAFSSTAPAWFTPCTRVTPTARALRHIWMRLPRRNHRRRSRCSYVPSRTSR